MASFNIEHIDTCLPCYLTDHHAREGEYLVGVPVNGSTTWQEVYDYLLDEALGAELPDSVTEDMIREAVAAECNMPAQASSLFDAALEDDDGNEGPQAWFLLTWEACEP